MTIAMTALLTSCTSAIAIGSVYNSAANRLSSELLSYAKFTDRQQREIRQRVFAFHSWHRGEQLPQYRNLLWLIIRQLGSPNKVESSDVESWIQQVQGLIQQLTQCNPLNHSASLLGELSVKQVLQIEKRMAKKHSQRIRDYQSETNEQRLQRRQDTLVKWAARAGIKMSQAQKDLLYSTLQNQISLTPIRHRLWKTWSDQLITLIKFKNDAQYEEKINHHITLLWNLTERHYPQQWQSNIALWEEFLFKFTQSMTAEQVDKLTKKLTRIANSIDDVRKKSGREEPICFNTPR